MRGRVAYTRRPHCLLRIILRVTGKTLSCCLLCSVSDEDFKNIGKYVVHTDYSASGLTNDHTTLNVNSMWILIFSNLNIKSQQKHPGELLTKKEGRRMVH